MKSHVEKTHGDNVIKALANFGGMISLGGINMKEPVLVAGTDGVGTKLRLAFLMNRHDTVGVDCVAMCVNDIVCHGAKPLLFLDYIATGKLLPYQISEIVRGVSDGCLQAGCALLGGETAEMPGFYAGGEYDLAGFAVGIVDREKLIDGSKVRPGDVLIGFESSGLHSNGYSLVRKLFDVEKPGQIDIKYPELDTYLGDELLKPTRIYVKSILELCGNYDIHGIANITGGGFIENIPRILPEGLCASIDVKTILKDKGVFALIQRIGNVPLDSMFNTFNMGVGMVIAVDQSIAKEVIACAASLGESPLIIGRVDHGEGVKLC